MLFFDNEQVEEMVQATWDTPKLPVTYAAGHMGRQHRWSSANPMASWSGRGLGPDASVAVKNMRAFVPADDQRVQVVDPLTNYAVSPPPSDEWSICRDDEEWERVQSTRRGSNSSEGRLVGDLEPPVKTLKGRAKSNVDVMRAKAEEEKMRRRPGLRDGEQLFEKLAVPARAPTRAPSAADGETAAAPSGLSAMFGGDEDSDGDGDYEEVIEDAMELTIYLPDRSPILMHVPRDSTCEDVLNRILRKALKEGGAMKEQLPADDISMYELRMHEADGEPEDFSIDRHALITTFGDDEFCICINSEARVSHSDTLVEAEEEPAGPVRPKGTVAVKMTNGETRTIKVEEDWTATTLLLKLAEKASKVRLLSEEYEFHVDVEEAERLGFSKLDKGVLPPQAKIMELDIREVELQRKLYADAPHISLQHATPSSMMTDTRGGGTQGKPEDIFWRRYNDITATMWEEWDVKKINMRKKEQRRKMGIGFDNATGQAIITNDKMDNSQKFGDVRTRSRPLRALKRVKLVEEGKKAWKSVEITWDDDGADYVIQYVTESSEQSMNIVCKLLYLQDMEKRKKRHKDKARTLAGATSGIQNGGSVSASSPRNGSQY